MQTGGRGKVATGLASQQMLWLRLLITTVGQRGQGGNIGAKLSDKRCKQGRAVIPGRPSKARHPPGERVIPGASRCAGHMAQTTVLLPPSTHYPRLLDTEGVSSILRGAADPEGVSGDGPGGMWGSGVESRVGGACHSSSLYYARPCWPSSGQGFPRVTVPHGGTQRPRTVWLL